MYNHNWKWEQERSESMYQDYKIRVRMERIAELEKDVARDIAKFGTSDPHGFIASDKALIAQCKREVKALRVGRLEWNGKDWVIVK